MRYLLVLTLLAGCGRGVGTSEFSIDRAFDEAVALYNSAAAQRGREPVSVSIFFGAPEGSATMAICRRPSVGRRRIEVSARYWDSLPIPYRNGLLLHELGHCMLGREHSDDPHSLMLKSPDLVWFSEHVDEALDELFRL